MDLAQSSGADSIVWGLILFGFSLKLNSRTNIDATISKIDPYIAFPVLTRYIVDGKKFNQQKFNYTT